MRHFTRFLTSLVILLLLAGCGSATSSPALTPSLPPAVLTSPTAAPTPAPSASPSAAPGRLLVLADLTRQPELKETAEALTGELARDAKLTPSLVGALEPKDLTPDVRMAVLLSAPANLEALLGAAPNVVFLAVLPEFPAARPNLSVIRTPPEQAAFLAGHISVLVSSDWRAAALLPDQPATLSEAFQNGGRFYCGRCTPLYAPIVAFPMAAALPAGSPLAAWQGEVSKLQKNILQTVYVHPSTASPELLKDLNNQKLTLVGGSAPDPSLKLRWAATVRFDLLTPLRALWPNLLSGKNLRSATAPLVFADADPTLLTPGKQRLVKEVAAGLLDGTIEPLSVK